MLPPTPHNFILFELDFDAKFSLLRLLLFLSDLKSDYEILAFFSSTFVYEPFLTKISMNTNSIKTRFFFIKLSMTSKVIIGHKISKLSFSTMYFFV